MTANLEPSAYHGFPLLKKPVWTWEIPAYFFVGGTAGAAALIGAVAHRTGGSDALVRDARWIAAAGAALSPPLLIADLGRPERFLNMLRVFKVQSPMSVGAWTLVAFSSAACSRRLRRPGAPDDGGKAAGRRRCRCVRTSCLRRPVWCFPPTRGSCWERRRFPCGREMPGSCRCTSARREWAPQSRRWSSSGTARARSTGSASAPPLWRQLSLCIWNPARIRHLRRCAKERTASSLAPVRCSLGRFR